MSEPFRAQQARNQSPSPAQQGPDAGAPGPHKAEEVFENCEMNEYRMVPISPFQEAHIEPVLTMFVKINI